MPCTFNEDMSDPMTGENWMSRDSNLTPAMDERFHVLTNVNGGGCGYCRTTVHGMGWGSDSYVLCLSCAVVEFGAPRIGEADEAPPAAEQGSDVIVTKRDKDFDPIMYRQSNTGTSTLSGRWGCAGYRCPTYPHPDRAIPANTYYMYGGSRGNLCFPCFALLKAKSEAMPPRVECDECERRIIPSRLCEARGQHDMIKICKECMDNYFMHASETDGIPIDRRHAVHVTIPGTSVRPPRRVYASLHYAQRNWFAGQTQWYRTREEQERELYSFDEAYRIERLARDANLSVFAYGTNIIKMLGFPNITNKASLCFGVELEMQPADGHTHAEVVNALGGKWVAERPYILCRDGSLGDAGVELITLPYTLAAHKADYVPWKKTLAELRKVAKSGKNTTQCGMHVHINRRALSTLQMGKMLVAINAPEMQELIATIAQRSEASYAKRMFKKVTEGGKIIGAHQDALNMSNRKGTAELRIFRGNLRYERVMKNIEFTEALCLYALEQSVQRMHIPEEMVAWINSKNYPYLSAFIKEEYQPTKAFQRTAARMRAQEAWADAVRCVNIEPTEGDL